MARTCQPKETTSKALTHQKHQPATFEIGTPTSQVRERGETFFLKFLSHLTPRVLTPLTKPKNTGNVFTKYIKASRRMHTSKHLEGCTHQSITKDAHIRASRKMRTKHLEGCNQQSISKDAHTKASRRMHTSKHLEGCADQSISKDAQFRAPRRMGRSNLEGCIQKDKSKDMHRKATRKAQ